MRRTLSCTVHCSHLLATETFSSSGCPRRYDAGSCHLEILFTIGSDLSHPFDIPLQVVEITLLYIAINCSLKTLDLLSDFPTRWRSKTPETTKRSFSTSPTRIVDVCTAKVSEVLDIGCGRGNLVICDEVRDFAHAVGAQRGWPIQGYSRPQVSHRATPPCVIFEYENWTLRPPPLLYDSYGLARRWLQGQVSTVCAPCSSDSQIPLRPLRSTTTITHLLA